jgi:EVE domain
MSGHWIIVVSAEHMARGRTGGFMQACHGKVAPLRRMKPGDGIVGYSPTQAFGGKDRLQCFTAIGRLGEREPYVFDMGGGFRPHRRDVVWAEAQAAPIKPLLSLLDFVAGNPNWGYQFRFGVVAIGAHDFRLIAEAMGAADWVAAAEAQVARVKPSALQLSLPTP